MTQVTLNHCLQVPIFYGTAEHDIYVPASVVHSMYDKTSDVTKVYANMAHANHFEPGKRGHERWTDAAAAFFGCHLQHAFLSCEETYGIQSWMVTADDDMARDELCPLCECDRYPMIGCQHDIQEDIE